MNANQTTFFAALQIAYADLFASDPGYAYSASKCTPVEMAEKMTLAAMAGTANTNGQGFAIACKACGIPHTKTAIGAYLGATKPVPVARIAPKPRKVHTLILSTVEAAMTAVWRINYAHGLVTLEYTDGQREAAKIDPAKWAGISEKPFDIVSHVQSCRVPANSLPLIP